MRLCYNVASASNQGSDKPVHLYSLARAFAACTHKEGMQIMAKAEIQAFCLTLWLHMSKEEIYAYATSYIISCAGPNVFNYK